MLVGDLPPDFGGVGQAAELVTAQTEPFLSIDLQNPIIIVRSSVEQERGLVSDSKKQIATVISIDALLDKAAECIQSEEWRCVSDFALAGLAEIGSDYLSEDSMVMDDTGLKLIAASFQEDKGRLDLAAQMRLNMLRNRLSLYKELHGIK